MKYSLVTFLLLALTVITFSTACERESLATPATEELAAPDHTLLAADPDATGHIDGEALLGYEAAVTEHVHNHSMDLDLAEEVIMEYPDGTTDEVIMVEGDIAMTKSEYLAYAQMIEQQVKQYRTSNLVSSPQTITVIGYTGGSYALTSKMRTGLSWAIDNYNALPLGLTFSLSFSSSTNADIVVYKVNGGAGGSAGFPSGGNPYKGVQIYSGLQSYDTNVIEHVMGHEIGHCLGLRHTDYFSRASCGQNSNEGSAGVGAIHIPGTPTGIDWNSLMLACFSSSEDGEFGYYDRVALEYLY
ncbi:MAG: peptidase [Lewinella sp.]|nr:peptidase [Lewinella sp.]